VRVAEAMPYADPVTAVGPVTTTGIPVAQQTRPLGVAVIAAFLLLDAALSIADILGVLPEALDRSPLRRISEFAPGLLLGFALVEIVAAIWLWRGSRRAWVLVMLLVGLALVADLYLWVGGDPRYGRLGIDVIMAFYLNQGVVRAWFERHDPMLPASLPPDPPDAAP